MLKPDRMYNFADSEVSFYMGEVASEGILVAYPTGDVLPPGLDDDAGYAVVPTSVADSIVGILLNEVENQDLSVTELRSHLNKVQINNKVEIVRRGWFVTDQVDTGVTPQAGDDAYFVAGGLFTTVASSDKVGKFEGDINSAGFVRVFVNIV